MDQAGQLEGDTQASMQTGEALSTRAVQYMAAVLRNLPLLGIQFERCSRQTVDGSPVMDRQPVVQGKVVARVRL